MDDLKILSMCQILGELKFVVISKDGFITHPNLAFLTNIEYKDILGETKQQLLVYAVKSVYDIELDGLPYDDLLRQHLETRYVDLETIARGINNLMCDEYCKFEESKNKVLNEVKESGVNYDKQAEDIQSMSDVEHILKTGKLI